MSNRKKPRKPKKKRNARMLSPSEVSITREVARIIRKAQEGDSRVVVLGGLALFSTSTGDAWMLDHEDGLALCLARDGVKQDYTLIESSTEFRIGWKAMYEIQGEAFTIATREGRVSTITGYPTDEILKAIDDARSAGGGGASF